ncbi:MAG: FAD-binding oxidoreductase [Pigmentiphaga sp.]|nr:FAD-binding oxidoreductase [Pigmentiphaga sp.]
MATVLVLGAGMVGTCTALHLALRGHTVTLVDRRGPGQETSYGNAGIIQREAVEPHPFPREACSLAKMALGQDNAVHYSLGALPAMASALFGYWANSSPRRYAAIARAYARLIEHSTSEHEPLIERAQAQGLVFRDGYRFVYREAASYRKEVARARRLAQSYGLQHVELDSDALAAAEPALRRRLAGSIHWLDAWSVRDPGALVERYAALFQEVGGTLLQGDAATLAPAGAGWRVRCVDQTIDAEHAVVALGPWTDALLRPMGYRYPLFIKRGYHRHYQSSQPPALPMMDADNSLVIVPMFKGVRITTGAEFARLDAPPTPVQLEYSRRLAGELINLGEPVEPQPWLGARPCTADMLPIMGQAPRHKGLWFNFGHAHQGFTLGPACGRLLADMIEGKTPYLESGPYLPTRFGA